MKFNKLLSKISIITMVFFSIVSCNMVEKTSNAIRKEVVATYDDKKLTRGEVEDYFKGFEKVLIERYGEDYKNDPKYENEQLKDFARNYAENSILIKEFEKRQLLTEEEVNAEVDEMVLNVMRLFIDDENGTMDFPGLEGHKINEQKLQEALDSSFLIDIEDYKRKQRDAIKINSLIEDITKDVTVSDEEISKYYEENKDKRYSVKPGGIMHHILVNTEDEALKVKERIENGEKFEDIAKELNKDATSQTGGSLGFVEYDSENYDKDFLAGAKNLSEGEISNPVKTQFGYHIIKVTNIKTETEYNELETVKLDIENNLLQEKKQEKVLSFTENLFKENNLKIK